MLADWIIDLSLSLYLVLVFGPLKLSVYRLPLEAQLVFKDNEVTQKSPTCFYSLAKTTGLPLNWL